MFPIFDYIFLFSNRDIVFANNKKNFFKTFLIKTFEFETLHQLTINDFLEMLIKKGYKYSQLIFGYLFAYQTLVLYMQGHNLTHLYILFFSFYRNFMIKILSSGF